ncbi:MAG: hypothetical protein M9899_03440 [Bdellovibrionaceae bacterium]|nr:hypothetical protein [Pseudobdellovibrionaceae bacterium]
MKLFLLALLFINFSFDPCIAEEVSPTGITQTSILTWEQAPEADTDCCSSESTPNTQQSPHTDSCLHCHFAHTFSLPLINNVLNRDHIHTKEPIPYFFSLNTPHPKRLKRPPKV